MSVDAGQPSPVMDRVGPFAVDRVLAHGGMSVVYEGTHTGTGARVAIKTVTLPGETYLSSMRREIHALSRVRHPGIVRILEHGVARGVPWYAMDLLQGPTLAGFAQHLWGRDGAVMIDSAAPTDIGTPTARLRVADTGSDPRAGVAFGPATDADRDAPLPGRLLAAGGDLPAALTMAHRLCAPLAFLHGEGIVHRDLKPTNIVIVQGRPVVVDFGLAWRVAGAHGREAPEVLRDLAGTPDYMAPEQATLDRIDPRTDLYALGCILYYLVAGRPPFVGSSADKVIHQHVTANPRPPGDFVDGISNQLADLMLALLAKRPRDRIGHALDVARALIDVGAAPDPAEQPPARTYVYAPNLAGRTDAFMELRQLLERARDGHGGLAIIGGASGIGKTYLAVDVAQQCGNGMRVITCECMPLAPPLHALRGLLTAIGDRCRMLGPIVTERIVGDRAKILAAIDPSFADLPGQAAHPAPPPLTGPAARDRLFAALRDTLAAFTCNQPLILIIDDLQWADELTLGFFATLEDEWFSSRSLVIMATCRDGDSANPLEELMARPYVRHLVLGALGSDNVAALIRDMLAVEEVPRSLAGMVAEQSGGNPFFVAEYLRAAVDEGHIKRTSSRTLQISELPTLASLQALVEHRLDGLGADARTAAEVAAVLGRDIVFDVLIELVARELDQSRALDAVTTLVAHHVLEQPGPTRLRFIHDKLQEIAYRRIDAARCRRLHAAAAAAIRQRHRSPEEQREAAMYLACHYASAGQPARAAEHLETAADSALRDAAFRRAVTCYERALELVGDHAPGFGRWHLGLAQAHLGLGELDDTQQHADHSLAAFGHRAPRSRAAWGLRLGRELAIQARHLVGARLARDPRARPATAARSQLGHAAVAAGLLSHRYFYVDDALAMLTTSLMSVNLAERAGSDTRVPRPYVQLAFASGLMGLHPVARGYFARARASAKDHTDPIEVAFAQMVEAVYLCSLGRWSDAEAMCGQALEKLRVLHDPTLLEMAVTTLGHIEYYTGRIEEAKQRYQEVLRSARTRASHQHATWGLFSIGRSLVQQGSFDQALPLLEEAMAALRERPELQSEIICGGLLAYTLLRCGEPGHALDLADRTAVQLRESRPIGFPVLEGYRGVGDVYLEQWQERQLARARHGALKMRRSLERFARVFPIGRPAAALHAGQIARIEGRLPAAQKLFERSVGSARELGMPRAEALGLIARATLEPSGSAARSAVLDSAHVLCVNLGCKHQLEVIASLRTPII